MDENNIPSEHAADLRLRAEALLLERAPEIIGTLSPEKAQQLLHELQVHQIQLEMQNEEMRRLHLEMDTSRARYFDLYDLAPVGYLTVSEAGMILEANFTAAKILGLSRSALVKKRLTRFIPAADQDSYYLHRAALLETAAPQAFDLRMLGRDRQPFWAHLAATLATDANGAAELRIVLSDITGSKQAEEELRETEAHNLALLKAIPDLIFVNRLDGEFLSFYASDPSLLYVSPEAHPFLHKTVREVLPQPVADQFMQAYASAAASGAVQEVSYMLMIGGEGKYFEARVAPSAGDTFITISRDVTERMQAQEALATERNLLRSLVNLLPTWIFVKDRESRFLLVNEACASNMGAASPEEMVGKTDVDYYPPEIAADLRLEELAVLAGTPMQNQEAYKEVPDGSKRALQIHKVPLRDRDGTIIGLVGAGFDITDLKTAEAELRAGEFFQRDILNSLPAHIAVLDPAGIIVEVNEPWLQFARDNGNPPIEKIGVGAKYLEVCHTAWLEGDPYALAAVAGLESVLAGKQTRFTLEYPCDSPDCPRWFSMEVIHLENAEGIIVAHTDISEAKQAEDALRNANQKLRLHFEQTPMAVIEWDLDFRVTQWNPSARTIFGHSRAEALGQHASFIIPKTFHPLVDEIWQALLGKTGGERSTNPNVTKDGRPILCEWYNTALIDEGGIVKGVASVVMDITERTHSLQLLAWEKSALESINSSEPLAEVLNDLMLGIEQQLPGARCSALLLDADGIHLRTGAAPSLPEAYNLAVDGVAIGPTIGSCGTAAFLKRQIIVADIARDPLWADYREVATHYDLHACWSTPILCSQGKVLGTFAIYYREPRSPTPEELELIERAVHVVRIAIERKRAEEEILLLNTSLEQRVRQRTAELLAANASLADFKAALDEHAIVSITDVDGTITYTNDKFCEISKYSREELLGQNHRIINSGYHPPAFFHELWQTILSGRVWKGEIKNHAKDGTVYWVSSTIVPFLGPDGKPSQFIAIRTDITTRKLAEEKISKLNADLQSRAAELEAANKELEAFTYSVSHDLRAPLRAVDGFSRMVIEDYSAQLDAGGQRMLGVIREETQRMGRLIDDLLAFSRLGRQQMEPASIDMHELAQEVYTELAGHEPERRLRLDLRPLPIACGSEPLIRQVWVNLISNAVKFTKDRECGEIEIGARDGEDGQPVYYVKDNGAGFDMRYADKLFGVFQRLHNQQEFAGTGVGLALVQRIVQRHGGHVWAEAEVDHGATFYFTLQNQNP